jgi:hypothetical protein
MEVILGGMDIVYFLVTVLVHFLLLLLVTCLPNSNVETAIDWMFVSPENFYVET